MYIQNNWKTKLKRYSNIVLPVIGIGLIALMLGIVWFWETNGREMYFYQEVIVLNQDVKRGTVITEGMLASEKIEADKIINNAVLDKKQIIGLEAKHFIPQKAQLHYFYFEDHDLITTDNKYIVRIPNEWLYSIPNSLRRKDNIVFYEINPDYLIEQEEENNSNPDTYDSEDEIKEKLGKQVLQAKTAYVKDSANREVVSISNNGRIDGSSVISEVLILITPEELRRLEEKIQDGGKFIIMHTEGGKDL